MNAPQPNLSAQSEGTAPSGARSGAAVERMALRAVRLRKVYGSMVALDELSFTVKPGEIVGLLGPNGAGKTTTINMILGVVRPTSGRGLIRETDLAKHGPV